MLSLVGVGMKETENHFVGASVHVSAFVVNLFTSLRRYKSRTLHYTLSKCAAQTMIKVALPVVTKFLTVYSRDAILFPLLRSGGKYRPNVGPLSNDP